MTLEELLARIGLGEDQDIEFKAADGGLPKSLWESFSAFGNTDGGYLGKKVADNDYEVLGTASSTFDNERIEPQEFDRMAYFLASAVFQRCKCVIVQFKRIAGFIARDIDGFGSGNCQFMYLYGHG